MAFTVITVDRAPPHEPQDPYDMTRFGRFAAAALLGGSLLLVGVPASADPIDCPPGQQATKNPSDGGWVCVNKGGNENKSEDPKNPNVKKGFFQKG